MIRLTLLLVVCLVGAMYFADKLPDPAPVARVEPADKTSLTESIAALISNTPELGGTPAEPAPVAPPVEQTASLNQDQPTIDAPSYLDLFNNPAVVGDDGNLIFTAPPAEPAPTPTVEIANVPDAPENENVTVRYVSGERVNVRAGPSTSEAVLDQVVYADAVQVLDETGDGWVHIRIEGAGVEGYMAGRFLQDTDPVR
ncbi:MAG: SH3 domain-containing protein [Marinosulfonomonas sp.]